MHEINKIKSTQAQRHFSEKKVLKVQFTQTENSVNSGNMKQTNIKRLQKPRHPKLIQKEVMAEIQTGCALTLLTQCYDILA